MGRWRRLLTGLANAADDRFDTARRRLRRNGPLEHPLAVVPYAGFGTLERLVLSGRVLEAKSIARSSETDTWRTSLRAMLRRLETDEIPGARVRARFGESAIEVVADAEGYFHVDLIPSGYVEPTRVWHDVELELLDPVPAQGPPPPATGRVLVPPPSARFGVISDIDDTVIWTNVTDKLRMLKIVFLENARSRLPFEGVAALYKAFQGGAGGAEGNPIFYVSGSPWNLYDLLVEIFEIHGIPEGPIRLRDFGTSPDSLLHMDTKAYKLAQIRTIMGLYPSLPFLLIGDSGEQDPEIYRAVVAEFPGRVPAVYIRNTKTTREREQGIAALADEVRAAGSELVLARDSRFAAEHAAARGWIVEDAPAPVADSVARDKASPAPGDVTPTRERPPDQVI